jgi:hypothetical protein
LSSLPLVCLSVTNVIRNWKEHRNSFHSLFVFESSGASDSLSNKLFGEIGGIPIAWSGVNEDACTNLPTGSCPIASGTKYVYTNTLTVEESYPNISLKIIWKIVDDAGKNQFCFKLPAKIVAA